MKFCLALAALLLPLPAAAAPPTRFEDWDRPQAPFRVAGDIWYVGTRGLSAWLIRTPKGAILLEGPLARNVPIVEANIRTLGLSLHDVKYLIDTHAHHDHAGGLAALKRDTGATMVASAADRWALEHGVGRGDNTAGLEHWPPVKIDRVIADGGTIALGGTVLTARLTPGHTPGCTSWTTEVNEGGKRLHAVFPCSVSVAGNVLIGNRAYPGIVADYRKSFALLERLPADVVLPAHPEVTDVIGRHERAESFVTPGLLRAVTEDYARDFDAELARQKKKG